MKENEPMKKWLIPVAILVLAIAGTTAGVVALTDGDGPASESLPPVSSDDASTQPGCELGASECDDTPDTCDAIPLRSDCGIDPDVCNQVHNIDACSADDLEPVGDEGVAPPPSDGDEPVVEPSDCEPVPLRSDCGIDPDVCNQVHNIDACEDGEVVNPPGPVDEPPDGGSQYEVTVRFNTSVTQEDIEDTADVLRVYDPDLEFFVQESWPPTGRAFPETDAPDFCDRIFDELASQSFIEDFSCGPAPTDGAVVDGDGPVVSELP